MGKKEFLKQIESLNRQIREHEAKIAKERNRASPSAGKIRHWETEITAFRNAIAKAEKRLRRGK